MDQLESRDMLTTHAVDQWEALSWRSEELRHSYRVTASFDFASAVRTVFNNPIFECPIDPSSQPHTNLSTSENGTPRRRRHLSPGRCCQGRVYGCHNHWWCRSLRCRYPKCHEKTKRRRARCLYQERRLDLQLGYVHTPDRPSIGAPPSYATNKSSPPSSCCRRYIRIFQERCGQPTSEERPLQWGHRWLLWRCRIGSARFVFLSQRARVCVGPCKGKANKPP